MFDWETFGWSLALVGVLGVLPAWICWKNRHRWNLDFEAALGLVVLDDDLVELIRRRVHAECSIVNVRDEDREDAEWILAHAACKAVVAVFRERNPKRKFKASRSWPRATVQISEREAIVTPWVGDDYSQGDGIEPVRVPVDWGPPDATEQIRAAIKGKGREQQPAASPAKAGSSAMEMLNRRRAK